MSSEVKAMIRSAIIPFLFIFIAWAVKITEELAGLDLGFLGIYPREWKSLYGILTAPFIHGDFAHLLGNTLPALVLGTALFYFYRDIALKIFILLLLLTGFWVWVGAREAFHIGASGVVYGLSSFIFFSGLIRKNTRLMALAMIVAFLYGSMIWGVFPEFFPEKNISWESHLFGILAGLVLALFFRKEGPPPSSYEWEDDEEDEEDENAYWRTTITNREINNIKTVYRGRRT